MNHKVKTIAALTGLAAVTIHIINRVQYSFCTVKNCLGCRENNYYEWRFGKIRYTKKGSGSPLLLIHDLTVGSSGYEFSRITEELSADHEVYVVDLLGYGLSDKPNLTYTNYLYVQFTIDFIKNVIGRKADIVATGDSAPIAVMTAHNDPEVVGRLVLINPQSLYRSNQIPSKQTKMLKLLIETPVLGTFIYNMLTTRASFEKTFRQDYFYDPYKIGEKDTASYLEASHTPDYTSKFSFASYVGRYMNANIIHALKEINHSTAIVGGEEEKEIQTVIDNYQYYNQAVESVLIPETKHLPQLEKPDEIIRQLNTFLS